MGRNGKAAALIFSAFGKFNLRLCSGLSSPFWQFRSAAALVSAFVRRFCIFPTVDFHTCFLGIFRRLPRLKRILDFPMRLFKGRWSKGSSFILCTLFATIRIDFSASPKAYIFLLERLARASISAISCLKYLTRSSNESSFRTGFG